LIIGNMTTVRVRQDSWAYYIGSF